MVQKKFLSFFCITQFLLIAVMQIYALDSKDNWNDETSNLLKEKHFYDPKKRHEKGQHKWHKNVYLENEDKFEDNKWLSKKNSIINWEDDSDSLKINKLNSQKYVDKYNKYGNTFKPEYVDKKLKDKKNKVEKKFFDNDKHFTYNKKSRSLLYDVNVNYMGEGKKKHKDSETIELSKSLLNDTNVKNLNDNKKIYETSEITTIPVNSYKNKENYEQNFQNKNQLYLNKHKKNFYQNLKKINLSQPPTNDSIIMARFIVHTVDWAVVGTLSKRSPTKGAPFVCVKAISDGTSNYSTGVPFFYMSPMDICTQDLQEDNRVAVLVTLSETEYCKNKNLDPQDPRCAKMTLSGKIKKIKSGSEEEKFAKKALFTRHPSMATWPSDHNWYFAKLKIGQIVLLDKFGGANYINVKDYLNCDSLKESEL